MTIFAPLGNQLAITVTATGSGGFRFASFGAQTASFGVAEIRFQSEAKPWGSGGFRFETYGAPSAGFGVGVLPSLRTTGYPVTIAPPLPAYGIGTLVLETQAQVTITLQAEGDGTLPQLTTRGAATAGFGQASLSPFISIGGPPVALNNYIYATMDLWGSADSGVFGVAAGDTVNVTAASLEEIVLVLLERFRVTPSLDVDMDLELALNEIVRLSDLTRLVFDFLATDSVSLTELVSANPLAYLSLVDAVSVSGALDSDLRAEAFIAAAVVLRDYLYLVTELSWSDSVLLTEAAASSFNQVITALDSLTVTPTLQNTLHFVATFEDSAVFNTTLIGEASLEALLSEGVALSVRLVLDGVGYNAFVMNTRNKAVSEYTNFDFTSFAELNGKYYGAKDDGIYLIDGDTDDGEPIAAFLRTGLHTLGTRLLKQVHNAYVGYTTDGEIVLKVITTDNGTKKENWYKLNARSAPATTDNRFSIAKGLKSVYWQFELANVDGSNFQIDHMKVWPFDLQRRK